MEPTFHILLIDDHPDDRALVSRKLRQEFPHLQLTEVHDLQGFSQALAGAPFDLTITDYGLGWAEGLQVLKDLKGRWPEVPVIMFTDPGHEAIAVEAMRNGLDDYVLKTPRHCRRLASAVRTCRQRVQQRQAFKEAEERFRQLFNSGSDAIFVHSLGSDQEPARFLEVNETACQRLGYTREELLTLSPPDIGDPKKAGDFPRLRERLLADKQLLWETVHVSKDGRKIPVESNIRFIDLQGRPTVLSIARDITARRQAEEALKLEEARLEALMRLGQMQSAPFQELANFVLEEGVRLTKSKVGYLAFMNEAETELTMFAWSKEAMEICGILDKPLTYPVATTGLWGEAVRQRRPIITNDYAAPSPYKKGYPEGHVPVLRHLNLPVFEGDRIVAVAGVGNKEEPYDESDVRQLTLLMDGMWKILQRSRDQEALRQREQDFRLLVTNIPAVVFKGYVDSSVDFCDNKVEEITGHAKEEFDSRRCKWKDLILREDLRKVKQTFLHALRHDRAYLMEYRVRSKDGKIIWIQERSQIVRNSEGKVDFVSGIFFDISARKEAEEALRRAEQEKALILDSMSEVVIYQDTDMRMLFVNKAAGDSVHKRPEDLVGKRCYEVWHQRRKPCPGCPVVQALKTGQAHEGEITSPDGRVWFIRGYPNLDSHGRVVGVVEISLDITARKQAEALIAQSLEKLQQTLNGTVTALAATVETRDPYTAGHQRRVTQLACAIAQEMWLPPDQVDGIRVTGFIHDIGKIAVPAEILSKPSLLTRNELQIVQTHPQVGFEILRGIEFPWPVAQAILQHHERLNGSGYPFGLTADDIILEARILMVADVVEAMASHRPYRPGLGVDQALEEIHQNKGALYDPEVVEACLRLFKEKGFKFE